MEKSDKILFGKYKGKTWQELLDSPVDCLWGDWWSKTHSKGAYSNRENKMKNTWRTWRGLENIDTKNLVIGFNPEELNKRLEEINKKLDELLDLQKEVTHDEEWAHEA